MQKIIPPTYNGPNPHPFSQQTLSSIYWRVPELQSSLIFLIKDQQYQIAPHFLAEKSFIVGCSIIPSQSQVYILGLERNRNVLSPIINSNM